MSKRLEVIAEYTKGFNKLADVACDHAKLSVYCVQQGFVKEAIASDINEGPVQSGRQTVQEAGIEDKVEVVMADGISHLPNDVDVIVCAGLGGTVMESILSENFDKLKDVKRIILQPNVAGENCRRFLTENGFKIIDELYIEDADITYEIMVLEHGNQELTALETLFGPINLKKRDPLFLAMLERAIATYDRILSQLPEGTKNEWLLSKKQLVTDVLNGKH